jgi:hypothetical protein
LGMEASGGMTRRESTFFEFAQSEIEKEVRSTLESEQTTVVDSYDQSSHRSNDENETQAVRDILIARPSSV